MVEVRSLFQQVEEQALVTAFLLAVLDISIRTKRVRAKTKDNVAEATTVHSIAIEMIVIEMVVTVPVVSTGNAMTGMIATVIGMIEVDQTVIEAILATIWSALRSVVLNRIDSTAIKYRVVRIDTKAQAQRLETGVATFRRLRLLQIHSWNKPCRMP